MLKSTGDRDDFIIPKHILEIYSHRHQTNPIPSVWDFGFVNESVLTDTSSRPYYEQIDTNGVQKEIYFSTPDYDIYLVYQFNIFKLYFLYNSQLKDSVLLAANKIRKYKIEIED